MSFSSFRVSRELSESVLYRELAEDLDLFSNPRLDLIMPKMGNMAIQEYGHEEAKNRAEKLVAEARGKRFFIASRPKVKKTKYKSVISLEPRETSINLLDDDRKRSNDIFNLPLDIYFNPPLIASCESDDKAFKLIQAIKDSPLTDENGGGFYLTFAEPKLVLPEDYPLPVQ